MPSFIQKIETGQPAAEQIVRAACQAIRDDLLVAGTTFPSVRQLGQELKISRTTAHKAVTLLKQAGFLASQPGNGMVVTVPKLPPVEERLKQLQPILCQLIDESARLQLKFSEVVAALKREMDKLYQAERERDTDLVAQLKATEAKAYQHRNESRHDSEAAGGQQ
jgi:DNA-binding transcriptional regulator YhcF (GntR family)